MTAGNVLSKTCGNGIAGGGDCHWFTIGTCHTVLGVTGTFIRHKCRMGSVIPCFVEVRKQLCAGRCPPWDIKLIQGKAVLECRLCRIQDNNPDVQPHFGARGLSADASSVA